jgi:hypothetical protein
MVASAIARVQRLPTGARAGDDSRRAHGFQ